jgi:DNA-binding NtrC family response regulator
MRVIEPSFASDEAQPTPYDEGRHLSLIKQRLIGVSRWATEVRATVAAHAVHDASIIIEGEPGTGKEFLARLIHQCSARSRGPFVAISCEMLSEESVEAALFGSIRVLPSGRNRIQRGLIEVAEGGTLYISGVGALSSVLKLKVSRLIKHQEFRRLGDTVLEVAHVRVILGHIRQYSEHAMAPESVMGVSDMLFIPPLRRRKADIESLSRHFVQETCRGLGKELRDIAPDTIALLRRHDWPGNVAELKKVIEEMVRQSGPPCLDALLLPAYIVDKADFKSTALPVSGVNLNEEVERLEKALLCAALKQCEGVQIKAAQLLGLKPTTLNAKIKQYGIDVRSFKSTTRLSNTNLRSTE